MSKNKLSVSNQTIKQWVESYIELQKCLFDEIEKGNLSKESYLLDFIYNEQDNDTVKQALTPPTEQEVCEALSEWVKGNIPDIWNYKVYYDTEGFHYYNNCDFEEYLVEYERIDKAITLSVFLPPHLLTMIGRFYEKEREDKK